MEAINGYEFDALIVARFHLPQNSQVGLPPTKLAGQPAGFVAGVDEAGRGPLAGPVVAAAVILPHEPRIVGLRDSKIIPSEQREALYCEIQETALAMEVAVIDPKTIDSINILQATLLAMRQCVQALACKPNLVIVDGNQKPQSGFFEQTIIRGDSLSASIMAASIVAKVTRDQIMLEEHYRYPVYGFAQHKGYGSSQHFEAIQKHGPCPIHRRTFEPIRSLLCPN